MGWPAVPLWSRRSPRRPGSPCTGLLEPGIGFGTGRAVLGACGFGCPRYDRGWPPLRRSHGAGRCLPAAGHASAGSDSSTPGVVSVTESGRSTTGLTNWSVVAGADRRRSGVQHCCALRHSTRAPAHWWAGPTRRRSTSVTQPRTIAGCDPGDSDVILLVLYALLRSASRHQCCWPQRFSVPWPRSVCGWASLHILGFPALDNSTPLFAFLFWRPRVDYTIFLVTRRP